MNAESEMNQVPERRRKGDGLGVGAVLTAEHQARANELRETGWPVEKMSATQILIAHEAEGDRNHRLAAAAGEHLDFVEVVEVFKREDGVYVFADLNAAQRFEAAVAAGRDLPGDESATHRRETPINVNAAAERLIAAERGDVLEDRDWPNVAEDVREGVALQTVCARLAQEGGEVDDALALLGTWIVEDREAGIH